MHLNVGREPIVRGVPSYDQVTIVLESIAFLIDVNKLAGSVVLTINAMSSKCLSFKVT